MTVTRLTEDLSPRRFLPLCLWVGQPQNRTSRRGVQEKSE